MISLAKAQMVFFQVDDRCCPEILQVVSESFNFLNFAIVESPATCSLPVEWAGLPPELSNEYSKDMKQLFLTLCLAASGLLLGATAVRAQVPGPSDDPLCQDCYSTNYNRALKLMDQRQYTQAKDYFLQALNCPDIPPQSDALSRYNKCINLIRAMKDVGEEEVPVTETTTGNTNSQGGQFQTPPVVEQVVIPPAIETVNNGQQQGVTVQQHPVAEPVQPAVPQATTGPEPPRDPSTSTLTVNGYTSVFWRFSQFGGAETFKVGSQGNWRVGKTPQWIMVMPNQAGGTFKLICGVNEGDDRTADILVTNGTDEVRINIHQVTSKGNALSDRLWEGPLAKCCENVTDSGRRGDYKGETVESEENASVLIRQGMGLLAWKDGTVYMGEFRNNVEDGLGMKILPAGFEEINAPNAMYVVGNWDQRNKSGVVNCYDRYGYLVYRGKFSEDLPTEEYPTNRDAREYRLVMETLSNGSTFLGETHDGVWEGFGALMDAEGNMWIGTWVDGRRNGKGAYLQNDSKATVTSGTWVDNNMVGM